MEPPKKKTKENKKTPKEPKEPKERKKKEKTIHFCEIKYYKDYPEEERERMFTVRLDTYA